MDNNGLFKEVDYFKYCKHCVNKECLQTEDPCNECLTTPARQNTKKPINYVNDGTKVEEERK